MGLPLSLLHPTFYSSSGLLTLPHTSLSLAKVQTLIQSMQRDCNLFRALTLASIHHSLSGYLLANPKGLSTANPEHILTSTSLYLHPK